MLKIAEEAHTTPEVLQQAPHTTKYGRMDEVRAARQLVLCCEFPRELYENANADKR
jgi:glycine dehydrogenase subunit 2